MLNAYRKRVQSDGIDTRESIKNSTKRQVVNQILDSPSLSYVSINMVETLPIPCIASDIDTINKRKFLFLPDIKVSTGDYVTYRDKTYLSTEMTDDEIYPQLIGELCNLDFPIKTIENKIQIGKDNLGRPIYKTEITMVKRPSVMTEKIYSQANNEPIPLSEGNLLVKIPYSEDEKENIPDINSIVTIYEMDYKISSLSYENILNGKGTVEVQLQRVPTT